MHMYMSMTTTDYCDPGKWKLHGSERKQLSPFKIKPQYSTMSTAAKRSGIMSSHMHSHAHSHRHSHCTHRGESENNIIQEDDSTLLHENAMTTEANGSSYSYLPPPAVEEKMRRELKYFFMNPYEKYQARGRKPWKLGVQLIKIVLVTVQLVLFGLGQFKQVTFFEDNEKAFNNIFLKDWSATYDSFAYPQTSQLYALYMKNEVYEHLDYAIYKFSQLERLAVGTYEFDVNETKAVHTMTLCNQHYAHIAFADSTFDVDLTTKTDCLTFDVSPLRNISVRELLKKNNNKSLDFDSMIEMKLKFSIRSFHVKNEESYTKPDCVHFDITILYDYTIHGGRIHVSLVEDHTIFPCLNSSIGESDTGLIHGLMMGYDVMIIVLCSVSLALCLRSLQRGGRLKKKTVKFFDKYYKRELTRSERVEFLNLWYIMIIASDLFTISGSIFRLLIETEVTTNYDACSLLLGTGCCLVWLGVLRYLGFFDKYNIPIITLKKAMPNCMRFIVCGFILYMAYAFCGWIVLGPYHHKFRSLDVSVECMFSLINGDDMFATFSEMSYKSPVVWLYSRIYLYSFISLFIYVVLSLFIALIMDTYETVKELQGRHMHHTELGGFIEQCCDRPESGCYRQKKKRRKRRSLKNLCCTRSSSSSDEQTPLLH